MQFIPGIFLSVLITGNLHADSLKTITKVEVAKHGSRSDVVKTLNTAIRMMYVLLVLSIMVIELFLCIYFNADWRLVCMFFVIEMILFTLSHYLTVNECVLEVEKESKELPKALFLTKLLQVVAMLVMRTPFTEGLTAPLKYIGVYIVSRRNRSRDDAIVATRV